MLAAVFLAGAIQAAPCPQFFADGIAPMVEVDQQICFTGFSVGYRASWGEPVWSAEELTPDSVKAGEADKRNGEFHKCDELPADEQISPDVYRDSGFDLGHMTPAGDRGADKPETFGTCNMVPQRPELNRIVWDGLETSLRDLATTGDTLYVVTGPEVDITPQTLGGKIMVPSSTWKAVYDVTKDAAGAWTCTNVSTPVCHQETIEALGEQIGFDPMPGASSVMKSQPFVLPTPNKGAEDVQ